jgi:hypothetical protein
MEIKINQQSSKTSLIFIIVFFPSEFDIKEIDAFGATYYGNHWKQLSILPIVPSINWSFRF